MATRTKNNRSKQGTKNKPATAEKSGAQAAPFDAEILERAKRIGLPPAEVVRQDPAREEERRIRERVGSHLLQACDQLGEELAAMMSSKDYENQNVLAALHTLWELRWDLGLYPTTRLDDEQAEQSAVAS